MKIIIGLGNPNPKYKDTRHNIGFMLLDYLVKKYGDGDFVFDQKLNADLASGKIEKIKVLFVKPWTFVNNSGEVLKKLKNKEKFKPSDIFIAHDDLDVPFGNAKLKFASSSAGHRGVESIIKALKTEKFWRLKIGTANRQMEKMRSASKKQKLSFVTKFVLSPFTPAEKEKLKIVFKLAEKRLQQILE